MLYMNEKKLLKRAKGDILVKLKKKICLLYFLKDFAHFTVSVAWTHLCVVTL